MTVEIFNSKTFEDALGHLESYESLGIINGEFSYKVSLDGQSALMIRSSVKENDLSASSSQDSIRVWLVGNENNPLAANTFKWVTRQPGWQNRLNDRMLEISNARALAGDCQKCSKPKGIYKTKKGKNAGKMFVNCFPCDTGFVWFDQLKQSEVWFSEDSHGKVGITDNQTASFQFARWGTQ